MMLGNTDPVETELLDIKHPVDHALIGPRAGVGIVSRRRHRPFGRLIRRHLIARGFEIGDLHRSTREISEEDADVLGQQYVLVEDDLAARNLPGSGGTAQYILARTDVKVLLGLATAAVDEEIRIDLDLARRLARFDLDVAN